MEKSKKEIVNKLLKQEITKEEESELLDLLVDKPIAVDVEKQEESSLTFGEKLADKLSAIAGSWTFILIFSLFFSSSKNFHFILRVYQKILDNFPQIILYTRLNYLVLELFIISVYNFHFNFYILKSSNSKSANSMFSIFFTLFSSSNVNLNTSGEFNLLLKMIFPL